MRRDSTARRPSPAGLASALAALVLATGCTRNYYIYGETPSYVVPGEAVVIDETCELPGRVFADEPAPALSSKAQPSAVASAKADPGVVTSSAARPPRVVISRPGAGSAAGRGWVARGAGSGAIATQTQGGADLSRLR